MGQPVPIPFPLSSFPGQNPQEGSGRLINAYAEPLGEASKPTGPAAQKWVGSAGLSQHAITNQAGYRGGLIVNNLSFEVFNNNVSTVDVAGTVVSLGAFPGTKKVSIARDQAAPNPDVVAVDVDNGAYILNTSVLASATIQATVTGASFAAGASVNLQFVNTQVSGFPVTVTYTFGNAETPTTIAAGLTALINANAALIAADVSAASALGVITISQGGFIGNGTSLSSVTAATDLTMTVTGAASGTGGVVRMAVNSSSSAITGDQVQVAGVLGTTEANGVFPVTVIDATHIELQGSAFVHAWTSGGTVTDITPPSTTMITFNPATGVMAGGTGTVGIVFAGAPLAYNGQGNLPQPNGVCNQDGYFFYTIADGRCFASALNSLLINPLTYIRVQAKADVTLLRPIPFSGVLLLFTTGSCEIWQDAANPAPNFPYARLVVLETGLIQSAAIAGFEVGFSELLWVAQDFGVYWLTAGSLAPIKVSPPDLDRLIEAQVRAGNIIEAGTQMYGGKKFWNLSSPAWTWEFNLSTKRWHEKQSWTGGQYGRARATCGHPAFGKWLVGDQQSGNILVVDDQNYTENGAPMLFRIESGPVRNFPESMRIARADFDFAFGVGQAVGNFSMVVLGASSGTGGVVRLTVNGTSQAKSGDEGIVAGITGTTEANGTWPLTVIDANHVELVGSAFQNAYVSGGTVTDITAPPGAANPSCAISCSKNGGVHFDNPSIRSLAPQGKILRSRASVKNRGQSGPMGVRWRIDITDPVYRSLMGGTMSGDGREVQP